MEEYEVKRKRLPKLEDSETYQRYCNNIVGDVPVTDLKTILNIVFNQAAVNMGKDSYDAPEAAIDSILEFLFKDYKFIPVVNICSGVLRGSLGQLGPGRLVPSTVYKWLREVSLEHDRAVRHDQYKDHGTAAISFDLNKYPAGKALNKKVTWLQDGVIDGDGYDKIPLMELAERIREGLDCVPELWGVVSNKKKPK